MSNTTFNPVTATYCEGITGTATTGYRPCGCTHHLNLRGEKVTDRNRFGNLKRGWKPA